MIILEILEFLTIRFSRRPFPLAAALLFCLLLLPSGKAAAQALPTTTAPNKVIGSTECGECHSPEESVWNMSAHFRSNGVHRDPRTRTRALDIATRLGIYARDIPTHARCVGCHGTPQEDRRGVLRVISGVSCESCHGGGLDYVDIHGEVDDYPSRASLHRLATAKGMRYPKDIHALGASCFQCHIVSDEELVNVGGHPARSEGFDLVSWSQGEMRHNFYNGNMVRHKALNHGASPQRCRTLYVTGLLLDLEHSLRALSQGEQRGDGYPYRRSIGTHAYDLVHRRLPALIEAFGGPDETPAPLREILPILEITDLTGPAPNVLAAAIAVEQKARAFAAMRATLPSAIDDLIPSETRGKPYDPSAPVREAAQLSDTQ